MTLWLVVPAFPLPAQTTNTAPVGTSAAAAPAGEESFGQYLVENRDDLAPFFDEKGDEIASQAAPLLLGVLGNIMVFTLLTCWVFDVALIRWFSIRFAPRFSKFRRALIYATGRFVLSVLFYALLGLAIVMTRGLGHEAVVVAVLFCVFLLIELAVQTGWVHYLYSAPVPNALLCYLGIFAVHVITGIVVSAPILWGHSVPLVTAYVDTNITPKLQAAADVEKHNLADTAADRDQLKAQMDQAQGMIASNTREQEALQKQIDRAKQSDSYLITRVVKLRAQGDLAKARDLLADLLTKNPNSPLADTMKTQLAGIDSDIAAQTAQKQQADAAAAQAAAQARADLLARAAQGQVTLSEMRLALVGKTPAEVTALFGPPAATDSDRWGYSKKMIIDPMTQDKFGLTIYFSDGTVQGVDYYYGVAPTTTTGSGNAGVTQ